MYKGFIFYENALCVRNIILKDVRSIQFIFENIYFKAKFEKTNKRQATGLKVVLRTIIVKFNGVF